MRKKPTAEEALKSTLDAMKGWAAPDADTSSTANSIVARNVLQEDLGLYEDHQPDYHLDQETRDRLIAHTRQDAAHALVNTIRLMQAVSKLERQFMNVRIGIIVICTAFVLWILWSRL
jgi:hypothetical protein